MDETEIPLDIVREYVDKNLSSAGRYAASTIKDLEVGFRKALYQNTRDILQVPSSDLSGIVRAHNITMRSAHTKKDYTVPEDLDPEVARKVLILQCTNFAIDTGRVSDFRTIKR